MGKLPLQQRNYVVVTRPNKPADTLELNPVAALNELRLSDTATQDIRLDFHLQAKIPLFGVDFEGGSGIYVDNFSSRGNTGQSLQALPAAMLKGMQAQHPYDLIVLQFGLNMIDSTRTNYYTYQQNLVRVITHLQQQFPNTAILVVGVSDKASKIKGEMQTNPCVPLISAAQRNAAIQTGAAFYNLFEAMGGYGSMVRWVNATPALANKDYTHPNHLGAHKIAGMITKYLLADFKELP
jgi:lysophospholipase L1-like esterase